jgi:hypothetical protein
MRELNTNSLDLLESKSKISGIESKYADYQRKDKLLKLTLKQLHGSNAEAKRANAQAIKSNALAQHSKAYADNANSQAIKSDAQVKKLQRDLINLNKKQNVNQSFLTLKAQKARELALQSHVRAVKATSIARKATTNLKKLESALTAKQAAISPDSNSYKTGNQPRLSVIDHPRLGAGEEIIKQVSNRDSVRLAKLSSSNEARSPLN